MYYKEICNQAEKNEFQNIDFDYIYSSPLKRATQTANIMIGKDFIVDERLKERSYGDWSGKSKDLIKKEVGEETFFLARRGWNVSPPNGESLKNVHDRVDSFLSTFLCFLNRLLCQPWKTLNYLSSCG